MHWQALGCADRRLLRRRYQDAADYLDRLGSPKNQHLGRSLHVAKGEKLDRVDTVEIVPHQTVTHANACVPILQEQISD